MSLAVGQTLPGTDFLGFILSISYSDTLTSVFFTAYLFYVFVTLRRKGGGGDFLTTTSLLFALILGMGLKEGGAKKELVALCPPPGPDQSSHAPGPMTILFYNGVIAMIYLCSCVGVDTLCTYILVIYVRVPRCLRQTTPTRTLSYGCVGRKSFIFFISNNLQQVKIISPKEY